MSVDGTVDTTESESPPLGESPPESRPDRRSFAFALGGLAGGNGHGAGFLRAALRLGAIPDMISCSSGMVEWVAHFCAALEQPPEERLDFMDACMVDSVLKSSYLGRTAFQGMTQMRGGMPRWIENWAEYWRRWLAPPSATQSLLMQLADRVLPNRLMSPPRDEAQYQYIAETIRRSPVPVVFNSYNPRRGEEFIYLNEAAWRLPRFASLRMSAGAGAAFRGDVDTEIQSYLKDVDAEAVEAAVWLYWYGFEEEGLDDSAGRQMDGAYHRHFLIRELTHMSRVFIVRPLHFRRRKRMPRNLLELRDFEMEMWLNASFAGELRSIHFVNEMLRRRQQEDRGRGLLPENSEAYHPIQLISVETTEEMGFSEYFRERMPLYWNAYRVGIAHLSQEAKTDQSAPEAADALITGGRSDHRTAARLHANMLPWLSSFLSSRGQSKDTWWAISADLHGLWQRPDDVMSLNIDALAELAEQERDGT